MATIPMFRSLIHVGAQVNLVRLEEIVRRASVVSTMYVSTEL
jgi:hypothetical protein